LLARVRKVNVGRSFLCLLDPDVEEKAPQDRELTARLYGGDTRISNSTGIALGVEGVQALLALGINPGVLHLNEGHSAFACREMIRQKMQPEGILLEEARQRVSRQVVFPTHTPVPAGHDRFPSFLVEKHLRPLRDRLGISESHLMSLCRVDPVT